jgi:hypothetical protein
LDDCLPRSFCSQDCQWRYEAEEFFANIWRWCRLNSIGFHIFSVEDDVVLLLVDLISIVEQHFCCFWIWILQKKYILLLVLE